MQRKRYTHNFKFLVVVILLIGGVCMAESQRMREEREWPIITKVARQAGLNSEQTRMLLAMRQAEMGPKGNEFGEMPVKGTDLETQARSAAVGIKNNWERYNKLLTEGVYKGSRREVRLSDFNEPPDFFLFMAQFGAPTGFGRTPIHGPEQSAKHVEINRPWPDNIRKAYEKITKQFEKKGMGNVKH